MRKLNFESELKHLYEQSQSHRESFKEPRVSIHSQNTEKEENSMEIQINHYYSKIIQGVESVNFSLKKLPNNFSPASTSKSKLKSIYEVISNLVEENISLNKELSEGEDNGMKSYEGLLQKLEAEIRDHIRVLSVNLNKVEQQLKLFAESTQSKIDDLEQSQKKKAAEERILKTDIMTLRKELEISTQTLHTMNNREVTSKKSIARERSISSNVLTSKAFQKNSTSDYTIKSQFDTLESRIADYRSKYMNEMAKNHNFSRGNLISKLYS